MTRETDSSAATGEPAGRWNPTRGVAEYSRRFHAALGPAHGAASPLGAYLLLAAIGPATEGAVRAELEDILGGTVEQVSAWLAGLLASRHPVIAAACAAWHHPDIGNDAITRWLGALPAGFDRGPTPDQGTLDGWARRATNGAIDRFPIQVKPETVLLLASALATSVTWDDPFEFAPSAEIGNPSWARQVRRVLARRMDGHQAIARTESAGLVAAEMSRSREGLLVTSVVADAEVAHGAVIAAAHEVAALVLGQGESASFVSLFDLPLGPGHGWDLSETTFESDVENLRVQTGRVLIPAWTAEPSTIDLLAERSWGIQAGTKAMLALLPPNEEGYAATAVQTVRAEFNCNGFSASAVSVSSMLLGASISRPKSHPWTAVRRHAETRFARPFAVVATALTPERFGPREGDAPGGPWCGLPVFTAWVTTPAEPQETLSSPPGALRRRLFSSRGD